MQLSNKILLFFFIFFFLSIVYGAELKIWSPELKLDGKTSEKICGKINVSAKNDLSISYKWAEDESRDLRDYLFVSEKRGIAEYPIEKRIVEGELSTYTFCFSSENGGRYYGVILFKIENTSFGVGSWIKLRIISQEREGLVFNVLNGGVINEKLEILRSKEINYSNLMVFELIFLIFVASFMLFLLAKKGRKKRYFAE
jgi:hypothetical protein